MFLKVLWECNIAPELYEN